MSATEDKSSTNTATTIPPIRVQSSVEGGGGGEAFQTLQLPSKKTNFQV